MYEMFDDLPVQLIDDLPVQLIDDLPVQLIDVDMFYLSTLLSII